MTYRLVDQDPEFGSIHALTAVLFTSDGYCLAEPHDPTLSEGTVRPEEHPLLDAVLRIPLETHGFRMQRVHTIGVDDQLPPTRWYCFMEGSPYAGRRPHAKVPLRHYPPEELAEAFRRRGADTEERLVRDATRLFRTQDDASVLADSLRLLEPSYLRAETPHGQSGVGGTAADWRRSREPVVDGLAGDGDFLDVGCANGHLMESVRQWAAERGRTIEPYGVDIGARLVALARARLPQWADRLWIGNALDWIPPDGRRFDHVHTRLDVAPVGRRPEFLRHLVRYVLRPGGRLIVTHHDVGAGEEAASVLRELGHDVVGRSGQVAWIDPPANHPST